MTNCVKNDSKQFKASNFEFKRLQRGAITLQNYHIKITQEKNTGNRSQIDARKKFPLKGKKNTNFQHQFPFFPL